LKNGYLTKKKSSFVIGFRGLEGADSSQLTFILQGNEAKRITHLRSQEKEKIFTGHISTVEKGSFIYEFSILRDGTAQIGVGN
jgi:hypothetical protein